MILISHRGNVNGRFESYENEPNYIDKSLSDGYDVEIDIWYIDGVLYLGHDAPQYGINYTWIHERMSKLWVHCKNIDALVVLKSKPHNTNDFWHQNDDVATTSLGYFWTFPGKQLTKHSIAVMPEIAKFDNISIALGVCSDYVQNYK